MKRQMDRRAHRPLQLGLAAEAIGEEDGERVVAFVT